MNRCKVFGNFDTQHFSLSLIFASKIVTVMNYFQYTVARCISRDHTCISIIRIHTEFTTIFFAWCLTCTLMFLGMWKADVNTLIRLMFYLKIEYLAEFFRIVRKKKKKEKKNKRNETWQIMVSILKRCDKIDGMIFEILFDIS